MCLYICQTIVAVCMTVKSWYAYFMDDIKKMKVNDFVRGTQFYMCGQIVEVLTVITFNQRRQVHVRWKRDGAESTHMLNKHREYRVR